MDKSVYRAVVAKLTDIQSSPSLEDLQEAIKETKVTQESRKQQVLKAVSDVMTDYGIETPPLQKIVRRLENHPEFHTAFK